MNTVSIPESFAPGPSLDKGAIFVPYISEVPVIKGRVSLGQHMISLITEGEKIMHLGNETIHLTPDRILMLAAGNVLFTERLGKNARIKSTMIFFDRLTLDKALAPSALTAKPSAIQRPYLMFDRDAYLRGFIESVNLLMEQNLLNHALQQAKFNELLLYMNSRYPDLLSGLLNDPPMHPEEQRLRQVIEAHLNEPLTLSELAFLCHMSLPTFKRKFEQIYRSSPARWLQIQRLTLAAERLRKKTAKPGEVYADAGYENHSSFSKAFKQYFGVLPKDYAL